MGLFGSKFTGQNALDFILGGTGGLDRRRTMEMQAEQKAKQDAAYAGLQGALSPHTAPQGAPADTQGLTPFAAALQGQAQGNPQSPTQPQSQGVSWDQLLPAVVQAQQAGVDTTDLIKAYQMAHPTKDYQAINAGDGNVYGFDSTTGDINTLRTDPYADLRKKLLEEQIAAQHALGGQRDASAGLSTAKARVGGFAPPRKSSGGAKSVGHSLPPGAVLIP